MSPAEEAALAMYHALRECLAAAWVIVLAAKAPDPAKALAAEAGFRDTLEVLALRSKNYKRAQRAGRGKGR